MFVASRGLLHPLSCTECLAGFQNAGYIETLASWIADAPNRRPVENLELGVHDFDALKLIESEGGILELVSNFQMHWQLRDYLMANKTHEETNPESDTVYIDEDFQDCHAWAPS